MRYGWRILRTATWTAALLAAAAVALVVFVLYTPPGGRLAVSVVNGRGLPVHIGAIDGVLARSFEVRDVDVRAESVDVHVDTARVAWRPAGLFHHRVDVAWLEVSGARATVGAADTTATRDTTTAPGSASGPSWTVHADRVHLRGLDLDAPGGLRARGIEIEGSGGPEAYEATVTARASAWRVTDARVFAHATGNMETATVDTLDVRGLHGAVRGGGVVGWAPGLSWRAHVAADSVRVGDLADRPDDWLGAVSLRARTNGRRTDDSTAADVDLESLRGTLRGRPLSARARVSVENTIVHASSADIQWGRTHAHVAATIDRTVDATVDVSIPVLAEILPRARGSVTVRGRASGTATALDANLTVRTDSVHVESHRVPDVVAELDARLHGKTPYTPEGVDIRRARVRADSGRLDVSGRLSWAKGVAWDLAVASTRFETSLVTPPRWNIHGPVSIHVATSGRRDGRHTDARANIESLDGTIRGRAVNGSGSVVVHDRDVDLSHLQLEWGGASVRANGHAGSRFDLALYLDAPDLSWIVPDAAGAVRVDGTLRGERARPAVDATVLADSIVFRDYRAAHVDIRASADLATSAPVRVHVAGRGLSVGDTEVDTVGVEVTGKRSDHTLLVVASRPGLGVALRAHGGLEENAWRGTIDSLGVRQEKIGAWQSTGAAPLRVSRSSAALDSLSLVSGKAHLDLHGAWEQGDTARVFVALHEFPMVGVAAFLPEGAKVTGTLDGTVAARIDTHGRLSGHLDATPGPGAIAVDGESTDYEGRVRADVDSSGVKASASLAIRRGRTDLATLDAGLGLAGFVVGRDSLGAQPASGHLNVDCADIAPLLAIVAPGYANASGRLMVRFEAHGVADDIRLSGHADLVDAKMDMPRLGVRLRRMAFQLESDGNGHAMLNGEATSGGGRIVIKAQSERKDGRLLHGAFSVTGTRFLVSDLPSARIFVSPRLDVSIAERTAEVGGELEVPYARFEIPSIPPSAVGPSSDVVFVEDTLATKSRLRTTADVRVTLGDSVTFDGLGLRARLAGSVVATERPGQPTTGTGEIQLKDGKYRAYGNDLTVDHGRFVLSGGPIDNPGIDLRASRGLNSQNVMTGSNEVVGVQVKGTLRRPEISLFSNPPMPDSEILSYLLFGRAMSQSSGGQQTAGQNAALVLGMYGGNQIAGSVGKQLSLDEAYFEAGETGNETSFVAGKYLSPKLFVSYVAGLFGETDYFRARYSLTSHWTLQGESGKKSGGDILYSIERGH